MTRLWFTPSGTCILADATVLHGVSETRRRLLEETRACKRASPFIQKYGLGKGDRGVMGDLP